MDNDLISRSALLEVMRKSHSYHANTSRDVSLLSRDIRLVNEAPAVDAETVCEQMGLVKEAFEMATADLQPVVRCKVCKHWMKDVPGCTDFVGRCEFANYMVGATGYCVYGERRADE